MGSEWKETTIADVAQVIGGGTPSSKMPEYWGEDIPWITPKDLSSNYFRYIERGERNISKLGLQKSSARKLPKNTVLVTSRAPIGYVAIAKNEVTTNQGFKSLILNDDQSPDFFYYLIKHIVPELEAHSSGSTFKEISGSVMKQIQVKVPPLPEQKAIAHILGTLDDKIELNRRMNATLEGMAQALFKSWFVDFDPVIDNALAAGNPIPDELAPRTEVRRQALANGTANREAAKPFPAAFQETEAMGWIPEGWKPGTIEDFCDLITSGGTPARMKNEYWESGNICWFKTGELLDGPLLDSKEKITQAGLDNSSCKLWPAGTILFALYASPTVGRLGVLTQAATANQAAAALIAKPSIGVPFLKQLLLVARSSIQDIAVGSAQQNINQKILKTHRVIKPSDKTAKAYSNHVLALSQKIEIKIKQTQSLAKLRDTLLPKLISGELRSPEAEQLTEEALA